MTLDDLRKEAEQAITDFDAAVAHRKVCEERRREALRAYNEARALDMGIVPGKTIIVVPARFGWSGTKNFRVVTRGSRSDMDCLVVQEVTAKNLIWKRRHAFAVAFDQIVEVTGEALATEDAGQ